MTLPSSGPLSFSALQGEFGGSNPIALSEYYAGAGLVPSGTTGVNGAVPSSGPLAMSKFYGTSKNIPIVASFNNISHNASGVSPSFSFNDQVTGTGPSGGNGNYSYLWTFVSGDSSQSVVNSTDHFPHFDRTLSPGPGSTEDSDAVWHVHISDDSGINTPYDQDVQVHYEYSRN